MRAGIVGLVVLDRAATRARYVPLASGRAGADLFGAVERDGADRGSTLDDALAALKPVLEDRSDREDRPRPEVRRHRARAARRRRSRGLETDTMLASYLLDATRSAIRSRTSRSSTPATRR